jgi:hypothetical protein
MGSQKHPERLRDISTGCWHVGSNNQGLPLTRSDQLCHVCSVACLAWNGTMELLNISAG